MPPTEAENKIVVVRMQRALRLPAYARALAGATNARTLDFVRLWRRLDRVPGWLRAPDGHLLYNLARSGPGSGAIVEIGSAWGRSTACLAAGTRAAGRDVVTAIDPHTGDDWFLNEIHAERVDTFDEFQSNITRLGLSDWVQPIRLTSDEAAATFPEIAIRLLFIDGLHTYEAVASDIRHWVPRIVSGGVVIFDDYPNRDPTIGVRQAVDELLITPLVDGRLRRAFNLVWTVRA